MDANLANAVLANVDSTIFQIFQKCIPLDTVLAWTEAQEQVDGQLAIASQVVDSATNVPDLIIATKMFWRSKDQGWPDWNQIIGCPSELLRSHPWYRSATPIPLMNATSDPLPSNDETAGSTDFTNVRESQSSPMSADGGDERAEALPRATKDKGKQREDLVQTRTQDAPNPRSETHPLKQTSPTTSHFGSPAALHGSEYQDTAIDKTETLSNEEDELEEEHERGRSTTRAISSANRRGNAGSKSRGRRAMFPTCSPGSQIPGACSSCRMSNYECSLFHHGGSCIQCKTRRKKCDYAGPRGPRRAHSRIRTRERSQSPSTHSPPSKRPRAQSRARRSVSPPKADSSQQRKTSPVPVPTVHVRASSRVTAKKNARPTAKNSDPPLTIVVPPLRKSVTAASRESGESHATTAAHSADLEERPIRPLPTRDHTHGSPKCTTGPVELGVTLGATYNLRGEPFVTREEYQELQRQIATVKVENDWMRSELKRVCSLIRDMDSSILSLQGTVEATRQFSIRSSNQRPEQLLSFPPNIGVETSQGIAPHLPSSSIAKPPTGE